MRKIAKILVPLDHSELAYDVLDMALHTADQFGAQLLGLRISSEPASLERGEADVDLNVIERETVELRSKVIQRAEHLELAVKADQLEVELRSGPLVTVIHEAVKDHQIDLIVMGTHGRHGIKEVFTGSTTEQIVAKSPASVLVVKPEGYPYLKD